MWLWFSLENEKKNSCITLGYNLFGEKLCALLHVIVRYGEIFFEPITVCLWLKVKVNAAYKWNATFDNEKDKELTSC